MLAKEIPRPNFPNSHKKQSFKTSNESTTKLVYISNYLNNRTAKQMGNLYSIEQHKFQLKLIRLIYQDLSQHKQIKDLRLQFYPNESILGLVLLRTLN